MADDKSLLAQPEVFQYRGRPAVMVNGRICAIPNGGEGDDAKPDPEEPQLDDDGNPIVPEPKVETKPEAERLAKLELNFAELTGRHATLQENYNVLLAERASQNQGRTEPAVPDLVDVPEEEFAAAMEAGDSRKVAQLSRRQAKIESERTLREFKAREIDPITAALSVGVGTLADHAMEIARPGLKYGKRFQKEIEGTLARLDPGARGNALMVKKAHDMVVGENFDTLLEEEIERRARAKIADPGAGPTPRRASAENKVPEPEELGGPEVAAEVARHGGKDAFAKKFGFGTWENYMNETRAVRGVKAQ